MTAWSDVHPLAAAQAAAQAEAEPVPFDVLEAEQDSPYAPDASVADWVRPLCS